jgi:uncharacterized repeat protein (TIGR01451 family)
VKSASNFFRTVLLVLALLLVTARAGAQAVALGVTTSSSSIQVSNQVTYTIDVTNVSLAAETVWVTNNFSGALPIAFVSAATTGTVTTNSNSVTFFLGSLPINTFEQVTLTMEPESTGSLIDSVVVNSEVNGEVITNSLTNELVFVTVGNTNQADLSTAISGFPPVAYTNDWVTYNLSVTNAGPAAATDVILTNEFPTNEVEFLAVSPSNATPQVINSNFIFNLGTLAAGAVTNFELTVEPTNVGVFAFTASVGSTTPDPNLTNNLFTTNLTVTNFPTATLTATISSTQSFDHLTGREEQVITLANNGATTVSASRVIVTGLTNWLSNAVGTNNGNPYVLYDAPLAAGQSVNLTLQFYPDYTSFLFTGKQLEPVEVEPVDLSLPSIGITTTNLNFVLKTNLDATHFLVEFKAITNRNYAIAYSDDMTNWIAAQPPFFVSANYGLWVDYGPPETLIHSNSTVRCYRVYMYPQSP